jgi:membrane protease YdiL (CAAX protease family)
LIYVASAQLRGTYTAYLSTPGRALVKHLAQRYPATSEVAWFLGLLVLLLFVDHLATGLYGELPGRSPAKQVSDVGIDLALLLIVFFPLMETLLYQGLPAWIGQCYARKRLWRWVIMVAPFGLAHYRSEAAGGSLVFGFGAGIIFGYIYFQHMARSHARAIWMTWALHAAINGWVMLDEMVSP